MICDKCKIEMKKSKALQNTLVGFPDFPGDIGREYGCTISRIGKARMVECLKCPKCGYSVTFAKD